MQLKYQCLLSIKDSDKKIYIIPEGTNGFFRSIKVDMIMCPEKLYKRYKDKLDVLLKEDGELRFI